MTTMQEQTAETVRLRAQVGKYQLLRRLGRGGMAEVYLAKAAGPMGFEKTLVVKRILPHLMEEPQFIDMFLSEARLAAQLNHANVVHVFDFGEEQGAYFIAMEYIDGPSLHALIKRARLQATPIPFPLCAKIVSIACEGLAYVHELADPETGRTLGLIHRDISADNILLTRHGGVKVVDFGIAKVANQKNHTQTGVVKGKVAYMSPEHLKAQPLDLRTDIYALGVVLYELVTGRRPFEGENEFALLHSILHDPMREVGARRPGVPKELERIIEKALAKKREQRYQSCRELQADLERFLLQCGEPVGPAQIAALVRQLTPPEVASGSAMTPLPLPSARKEDSPAPVTAVVPARPRWGLSHVAGLLLLVLLTGAGSYLGLRRLQRTPEPVGSVSTAEPVLPQPPPAVPKVAPEDSAVPQAPAPKVQERVAEPPAPAAPPQEATPALASFRVVSKPSGVVSVNGKRMGRTPLVVETKPGKVTVAVEGNEEGERFDLSYTLVVKPGVNPPVSLAPRRLKITVRGRPRDFKVQSLDLHFLGGSAGPLEVYEGWHTLKLTDPAGKSHTARCQARASDDLCLFDVTDGNP